MTSWTRFAIRLGGVLLAGSLAASTIEAQDRPLFPHYRWGIFAGANVADMTKTSGADARTGVLAGGTMIVQFSDNFAFQPELFYSQKGVKGTFFDDETSESIDITLKNDYVEMPLLARWTFMREGDGIRPFLLAGPVLAVTASCEVEGESGSVTASVDCDDFASMNNFEFAGLGGAGLEFPIGHNAVQVGARYTYGFSKVFDESSSKNRAFSFLLGFVF